MEIRRLIRENSRIDFLSSSVSPQNSPLLIPLLFLLLALNLLFSLFNLLFSKSCFIFYPNSPSFSIYIVRPIPSKHRKSQTVSWCSKFYRIYIYIMFIAQEKYKSHMFIHNKQWISVWKWFWQKYCYHTIFCVGFTFLTL